MRKIVWLTLLALSGAGLLAGFPLGWFVHPYVGAGAFCVSFLILGVMNLLERLWGSPAQIMGHGSEDMHPQ